MHQHTNVDTDAVDDGIAMQSQKPIHAEGGQPLHHMTFHASFEICQRANMHGDVFSIAHMMKNTCSVINK